MEKQRAFKETPETTEKAPYFFWLHSLHPKNSAIPHYGETIEINIYENVVGEAYVGGQHYHINGDALVFVAPNIVHSFTYQNTEGFCYAIKIHPELLKPIFDIDKFLEHHGASIYGLPAFANVGKKALDIAREYYVDKKLSTTIVTVVKILQLLIDFADDINFDNTLEINNDMIPIIVWTEKNFINKISIDEVAARFGYNKHYFCRKFKRKTGITYVNYLNKLRIDHAQTLLKSGHSIIQTCGECGFDDLSYFTQLFKKNTGITPKKYLLQNQPDKKSLPR